MLGLTAGLAPLSVTAATRAQTGMGHHLRSPAPSRTVLPRSARSRLGAQRTSAASLPVGPGVSANLVVSPAGDAFETTAVTTDPGFHRSVYATAENQSTGRIGGFASGDAGVSYVPGQLPVPASGPNQLFVLPSAAFDANHNLYESYVGAAVTGTSVSTQLLVAQSADRGHTWQAPVTVDGNSSLPDSPQVAVDATGGTFNNRAYVTYNTNPGSPGPNIYSQPVYLAHSEGGAWTKIQVADTGGDHESHAAIGPNGEVYLIWDDYCGGPAGKIGCPSVPTAIRAARSDDGGNTFPLNYVYAANLGGQFPFALGNYSNDCGGSGPNPIEPSPSIAVDRSGGPYQGNVYAVFVGITNGPHIYFARSTDRGASWSYWSLDNGNPRSAWGPAIAVDQSNGVVTVAWYDRRDDPANLLYRVYYTQSVDGGQTFLPSQVAVSDKQSDPTVDCLATGTYIQMRAADGFAQPFWTDTDTGSTMTALVSERANMMPPAARVFGQPSTIANSEGTKVVTGDFNGDGKLDLAVLSRSSSEVSIFLGTGDGAFTYAGTLLLDDVHPNTSYSIVAADFDGDKKVDLAVSGQVCISTCGPAMWLLRGNGDGTFTPPTAPLSIAATELAVGDFNGDSKPDLVLGATASSSSLAVMLNNSTSGNISFNPPVNLGVDGRNPVVADFNGDREADIAFTHVDPVNPATSSYVGVLLGNGDGTFQTPRQTAMSSPTALAAADLRHNGTMDLVAGGSGVVVMLGNGDGTFVAHSTPAASRANIAIGDFTGDGIPDIATSGVNDLSVMIGNGDGTFGNPATIPYGYTGDATTSMAAGDFNADGQVDLVLTESDIVPVYVALSSGPRLQVTRAVNFGSIPMGQSANQLLAFTNRGTADLHMPLLVTESPDFAMVADPCSGATIKPGASCAVTMRFTPSRLTGESATLTAIGDAPGSPFSISLQGSGARASAPAGQSAPFRPRSRSSPIPAAAPFRERSLLRSRAW